LQKYEEFKVDQIKKNPSLKRSYNTFLRKMYEEKFDKEEIKRIKEKEQKTLENILLTTETIPPFPIKKRIELYQQSVHLV
jgi:hypothetical protein